MRRIPHTDAGAEATCVAVVYWCTGPRYGHHGRFELPLMNLVVVIAVALAGGPGAIALDNVYGTALPSDALRIGGLLVILGWLLALVTSTLTAVWESASTV